MKTRQQRKPAMKYTLFILATIQKCFAELAARLLFIQYTWLVIWREVQHNCQRWRRHRISCYATTHSWDSIQHHRKIPKWKSKTIRHLHFWISHQVWVSVGPDTHRRYKRSHMKRNHIPYNRQRNGSSYIHPSKRYNCFSQLYSVKHQQRHQQHQQQE